MADRPAQAPLDGETPPSEASPLNVHSTDTLHCSGLPVATEGPGLAPYLQPSYFLDSDTPSVRRFVEEVCAGARTVRERAVRLFYAVRDRFRYDPYWISVDPADYRASAVIARGTGWCVPKASLLAAAARAAGIPSAIGLADVVNHLNTEKLRARMGCDIFYDHGYVALLIDGVWVKAVPAFNIELCQRFGVQPTDFDGRQDALYQQFNALGQLHMQYLADHGCWNDLPLDKVFDDFRRHYPLLIDSPGTDARGRFEDEGPLRTVTTS